MLLLLLLCVLQVLVGLNKRDARYFDMYRVNLATGELTQDTENPGKVGCIHILLFQKTILCVSTSTAIQWSLQTCKTCYVTW